MNLARDPRWGRISETYGEDPNLTATMAAAVVEGLQGNHTHYVKVGGGEGGGREGRDCRGTTRTMSRWGEGEAGGLEGLQGNHSCYVKVGGG